MNYKLEVLSPVHIGTGKSLTPLEFILDNDFIAFDLPRLCQKNPKRGELIAQEMMKRDTRSCTLSDLLEPAEIKDTNLHCYRTTLSLAVRKLLRGKEVNQATKSPCHRIYIPGSSIKGALRTAVAYNVFKSNSAILQSLLNKPFDDFVTKEIFRGAEENATHDVFRAITVTDSIPQDPAAVLELVAEKVLSIGINAEGIGRITQSRDEFKHWFSFYEAVKEGTTFQGKIEFNNNVINSKILGWKNHQYSLTLDYILQCANNFAKEICSWEKNYFGKVERNVDVSRILSFYGKLEREIEHIKEHSCYLSIGHGSGWHKLTAGMLIEKSLTSEAFKKFRKNNKLASNRLDFQLPKTRKLVMLDERPFAPFGWIKLIV